MVRILKKLWLGFLIVLMACVIALTIVSVLISMAMHSMVPLGFVWGLSSLAGFLLLASLVTFRKEAYHEEFRKRH